MIFDIASSFFSALLDFLNTQITDFAAFAISFMNKYVLSFFSVNVINQFLDFSTWVNILVFAVSFIVVAVDIAEEKVSGKPVYFAVAFTNIAKAFAFALLARWIAVWSMEIANTITTYFGLTLNPDSFALSVQNILKSMLTPGIEITATLNLLFMLVVIIAILVFCVNSLKRFGEMFIHIFTSVLYIPDIMRGDTTKMGEWLRQMIAIVLTYFFIYIMFFLGCGFFNADNILLCLACWITMPAISKILNKFGWSSGSQGNFGAMALQTGVLLIR